MTPDAAPSPMPAPQSTWIERQEHSVAAGLHAVAAALDPVRDQVEVQLVAIAHKTWQNAATWAAEYFTRNEQELGAKAAQRIVAAIVAKIPGAGAFAPEISSAIVTEAGDMFAVLIAELRKEGQVIAPPPPPAPAPLPLPPATEPAKP